MPEDIRHVLFVNANDTSRHTSSANTSIYPNLGLLTLMSALKPKLEGTNQRLGYFDGTVHSNAALEEFIDLHAHRISALCFSVLTANYGASIALAKRAKAINPDIQVVLGNDHFSALYDRVMANQPVVDFGFYGNDVVEGFADFVSDRLTGTLRPAMDYAGLVYRDSTGTVHRNPENPAEYHRLPLVDYGLVDTLMPHEKHYLDGQQQVYFFMRDRELRSQVVDIGRGCVKFAGERLEGVPLNACDFCGIIPGVREIIAPEAERAWRILENVWRQGFNYFYITADELPLTLWRMLRAMAANPPAWYLGIPPAERPKMFGYARAEAFATGAKRIDILVNQLGVDHFFIGFDGLSDVSLRVMNKQPIGGRGRNHAPMDHNLRALEGVIDRGGMITAGLVVTHLGITPDIMAQNHAALTRIVEDHPTTFAALDFGPLCPIPGSQSYRYLTHPEHAEARAAEFGLEVDRAYLESRRDFYRTADELDMDEMIHDFVNGCCPHVTSGLVDEYVEKMGALATKHGIVIGGGV
ncbi:radical SAM protein [Streptomyces sp. V3I7]|uniref:B12-binding domain-containing radical SAM protein n=1 Tax=Streptomyces sp. V3I7 TaxID=3042278 RepID=UPI0027810ADF|nr:cobalamin-dependent protein [Streptomyces sp. V3I7]MDQ0993880.1 anaerobic magnesium-protoporphyrin IX monomethyl ester cyclase [Streptomyces sp. V3I7]